MALKEISNGFRLDEDLYLKYRRASGVDTVIHGYRRQVFPNGLLCYPLGKSLGVNGEIKNHEIYYQQVKFKPNGKVYKCDGVFIHYYRGYYYSATFVDENGSHAVKFIENINSSDESVIEGISEFKNSVEYV